MRNIVKKFVVIFLATIITLSNFLNTNSIFAAENLALATGYVNIPSWITKKELNVRVLWQMHRIQFSEQHLSYRLT